MNPKFLVRVERSLDSGKVSIGTAYPVAPGRILVARHVLAEKGHPIDTAKLALIWCQQPQSGGSNFRSSPDKTRLAWDGGPDWDASILECSFPLGVHVSNFILSDRCPKQNEKWGSWGFARTGATCDGRTPQPLKGKTFDCLPNGGDLHLEADAPPAIPEGWKGVSGAPVFIGKRILGLVIDGHSGYATRQLIGIPMFRLLEVEEFRIAVGLPPTGAAEPIDPEPFLDEIAKLFRSEPHAVDRLEKILHKPQFVKSSFLPSNGSTELRGRARCLAERLVGAQFSDAMRVLRMAIESCSIESEETERKALFKILCWFLPAAYDLKNSEIVRWAYEKGDVLLLEAYVTTAIAAELRMAAIGRRQIAFKVSPGVKAGLVALHKIPFAPTRGLGASEQEELLTSIDGYLFEKYGSEEFPGPPEEYREEINELLRVAFEDGLGAPYLLFGGALDKSDLKPEELEELAQVIKEHYPALAVLRLSDDVSLSRQEYNQLSSLLQILKKA